MGSLSEDRLRYWVDDTLDHILEMIDTGVEILFQYQGRDYFIECGNEGYLIQDPQIEHRDAWNSHPFTDYPGSETAKTSAELKSLPFLDGKTIVERFDELRFFDL
jgi:hypothetical protein